MANKTEMSLDDIIKSNKNSRGRWGRGSGGSRGNSRGSFKSSGGSPTIGSVQRGRGRGGISRNSSRGGLSTAWKHALFNGSHKLDAAGASVLATMGPAKLVVSNLYFGVTDSDIEVLFAEFGSLKSAYVHYDRSGRSLGTADIIFERKSDAIKAMKKYNAVPLNGRAMNIQIATSHIPGYMTGSVGGGKFQDESTKGDRTRASRGQGSGRTRKASQRKQPTAKELDAELDAYTKERRA